MNFYLYLFYLFFLKNIDTKKYLRKFYHYDFNNLRDTYRT